MFPCNPPFLYSGVGEIVAHGSFDFVPERFVQRTVPIVNKHALTVPGISGEECGEPELVWSVKILEGAHTAQKKHRKLAAFLGGLDQLAPLRRENLIPARRRSLFCSRI